jgi:hypothetical protein
MIVKLTGFTEHIQLQAGSRAALPTGIAVPSLKGQALIFIPSREFYLAGLDYITYELGDPVKLLCLTRASAAIQPGMVLGELFTVRVSDPT